MQIDKILRNIILVGVWLIPFIPLYVADGMFFPFITGKNFTFRILVEIVVALWAVLVIYDRSYAPKRSLVFYSVVAFLAIMTIADIFGANFYRSFWSNYERMEGLVALIHMFGYFIVLGSVLNTEKLWDRYFKTILGVGVLIVLFVFGQLVGFFGINQGSFRVDATFGNSTYLAVHMLFLAFIASFYYFRNKEVGVWKSKLSYLFLTLAYLFVLYKTATRGALIGLVCGVLVTVVILSYFGGKKIKKISAVFIFSFLFLGGIFYMARDSAFIKNSQTLNRFTQINFESISKEPRLMVWGMALKGFKERPVLGWGQDNFNLVFNKYYNPGMYGQEPWFDRAHDVFFDWLTAGGLLGLLAYLSIFAVAIFVVWKRSELLNFNLVDKAIFTGMFVAYFIQNIFVFDNLMSYTMFFTLLAYLHYGSKITEPSHQVHNKTTSNSSDDLFFVQAISSIILISLMASIYFINIKPILASRALIGALSSQDLKQGLAYFKQALSYKSFGSAEAREQLVQRSANLRGANVDNNLKLEYFNLAKDEMQKQVDSAPDDARYRVFMTTLFGAYGFGDDAFVQAKKASELSPNKQTILFQLISAYINKKDYDKAFDLAKYAYDLDPKFYEAEKAYAIVSIYANKNGSKDIQNIINSSTNSDFHLQVAAAYLAVGQRAKSIEELKLVIKLKPEFKQTGERFISEIRAGRNP